jgi:hypothetical protein
VDEDRRKPTKAQLDLVRWLVQETQSDPYWFDELERMTRHQVQEVSDKMSVGVDVSRWEG